ncbi:hypothetical protein [Pleionea mediterranea]|uniref:Lipoprotein n=1 Tax=Pleionea mediterranea TaxID=523701 RepID=A0A316FSS6_9GAMM|nr:hypothetical protein [Pleionea mediterranea]PWK51811.1 hypothetical protein C8D97_105126 [Pleionea mediterranea]
MKRGIMENKFTGLICFLLVSCSSNIIADVNLSVELNGRLNINSKEFTLENRHAALLKKFTVKKSPIIGDASGNEVKTGYYLNNNPQFTVEVSENKIYRINVYTPDIPVNFREEIIKVSHKISNIVNDKCSFLKGEETGWFIDCGLPSKVILYTDCKETVTEQCVVNRILLNNYP